MRRSRRPRRLATLLVLVGCLSILGGAFAAGVYTGRVGARTPGHVLDVEKDAETTRRTGAESKARDRARPTEPEPRLTFYQELTAPLTAPPPIPKPARPRAAEPAKPREAPAESVSGTAPASEFTVQVAAYKAPGPAEALRATLAAAGWESRVVAAELGDAVRYRVQVGSYPTREAARAAAARLATERSLPTLITTR